MRGWPGWMGPIGPLSTWPRPLPAPDAGLPERELRHAQMAAAEPGDRLPSGGPALYLYPANSPLPEWVAPYLANATATAYPAGGAPLFTLYELSEPPPLSEPASPVAIFADAVTLLSVTTEPAAGGDRMPVTLTWRVDGPLPPEWAASAVPFVHLEDSAGFRWAQAKADAYPSEQWTPGETIRQRVDLPLPDGIPPGEAYTLRMGLFDPATRRLSVVDASGALAGTAAAIPGIAVIPGPLPEPLPCGPAADQQDARRPAALDGL